ncbi:NeuD/PglB/VioB family sugar acetyltransferase [Shewanella kaireitica]|uniref:NeuD/PglB/VioB family sugar acetyltransferase n=1 Tax=Shewanella kaireitica TaxID=212021 RepID=UPI00200DCE31|nr:NeuD/PglB/VioB family sugar acetyltransferase [Shewanella kaireitica]MCL1093806.1 NeuD/PglB/VioB family sugar acetyltransferase [Shewanella kaireitica]
MEKVLIGAGGAAREIMAHMKNMDMKCFVDDKYFEENSKNIYPISSFNSKTMCTLIAVGDSNDRKLLFGKLPADTQFFSFIHESAQIMDKNVILGQGVFISANCVITTNIKIGSHSYINRGAMIGHDCNIGKFFTMMPSSVLSGSCSVGDNVLIGANASIRENVTISSNVVVGMQSAVLNNIVEEGTYVGVPAKLLSY